MMSRIIFLMTILCSFFSLLPSEDKEQIKKVIEDYYSIMIKSSYKDAFEACFDEEEFTRAFMGGAFQSVAEEQKIEAVALTKEFIFSLNNNAAMLNALKAAKIETGEITIDGTSASISVSLSLNQNVGVSIFHLLKKENQWKIYSVSEEGKKLSDLFETKYTPVKDKITPIQFLKIAVQHVKKLQSSQTSPPPEQKKEAPPTPPTD